MTVVAAPVPRKTYGESIEERIRLGEAAKKCLEKRDSELAQLLPTILFVQEDFQNGREVKDISLEVYRRQVAQKEHQFQQIDSGILLVIDQVYSRMLLTLQTCTRPDLSEETYTGLNALKYDIPSVRSAERALKRAVQFLGVYSKYFKTRIDQYENTKKMVTQQLDRAKTLDPLQSTGIPRPLVKMACAEIVNYRPQWVVKVFRTNMEELEKSEEVPILNALALLLCKKPYTQPSESQHSYHSFSHLAESCKNEPRGSEGRLSPKEKDLDYVSVSSLSTNDSIVDFLDLTNQMQPMMPSDVDDCSDSQASLPPLSSGFAEKAHRLSRGLNFEILDIFTLYQESQAQIEKHRGRIAEIGNCIANIDDFVRKLTHKKGERVVFDEWFADFRKELQSYVSLYFNYKDEIRVLHRVHRSLSSLDQEGPFLKGFERDAIVTLEGLRFSTDSMRELNDLIQLCDRAIPEMETAITSAKSTVSKWAKKLDNALYYSKKAAGDVWFVESSLSWVWPGHHYLDAEITRCRKAYWDADPSLRVSEEALMKDPLQF